MSYTILFDTETTGLLKPDEVDLDEQPYIIEFFATKLDDEFNHIGDMHFMIKPPIPISDTITRITSIRKEDLMGKPSFAEVISVIADFFLGTKRLVAHNLAFDRGMLWNELGRLEQRWAFPWPPEQICTVEASMPIQQRRMSLSQLHKELIGKTFQDSHRAKNDVYALVRCYHALMEKGMISL